jgi:hypothetical protein
MTKLNMIKELQLTEARLWLEVTQYELGFGIDHPLTDRSRIKYVTISCLLRQLNVEPNIELTDNQTALKLRRELIGESSLVEE